MYAKTEFLYLKEDRKQNVPLQKQKASDGKPLASWLPEGIYSIK